MTASLLPNQPRAAIRPNPAQELSHYILVDSEMRYRMMMIPFAASMPTTMMILSLAPASTTVKAVIIQATTIFLAMTNCRQTPAPT
jgi:hypothetical protein